MIFCTQKAPLRGAISGRALIAVLLIACSAASAESFGWANFSAGIKAGVPVSEPFYWEELMAGAQEIQLYSASKQYIVGPMVEVRLPFGLAVEADGLYRPVTVSQSHQYVPTFGYSTPTIFLSRDSTNVSTWEIPVLAKYRFKLLPFLRPYVEAGPDFRKTVGALYSWEAGNGLTAGGGVEIKVLKVRIAPEVRYIRWGPDSQEPPLTTILGTTFLQLPLPSRRDQVEFLVGFSF
jgi:hypothetical protein